MQKRIILAQIFISLIYQSVQGVNLCKQMLGVNPSDSLDYTFQTIGLNTVRSYQLAPGTVCQLNFDGIDN